MLSTAVLREKFIFFLKKHTTQGEPANLYQPIEYIMGMGGKRLRPLLCLIAAQMFGKKDLTDAFWVAASIDYFHNFTLVHDDIMDEAPLRRGQPTIHKKWNLSTAILSGDLMLIKVYEFLNNLPSVHQKAVVQVFNKVATGVCEGQQLDMDFENQKAVQIEAYLQMIGLKTAILLAGSLQMGAIVGNATPKQADALYQFGYDMGMAFQLQDDLLDTYGNPQNFGKQVGGDILQNKKTFLLLKALELAEGKALASLQQWLQAKDFDPCEKVSAITKIYNILNIKQITQNKMQNYYQNAFDSLTNLAIEENRKQPLFQLVSQLMYREK